MRSKGTLLLCWLFLLTCCLSYNSLYAQTERNIGLRFSGVDNLNFIYKKQVEDSDQYKRFRIGFINANYQIQTDDVSDDRFTAGIGMSYGLEKRTEVVDKLMFYHGLEPFLTFRTDKVRENRMFTIGPGLGYVLGFLYDINDHFYVSIETIPSFYVDLRFEKDVDLPHDVGFGFNANAVHLSVCYVFEK